MATITHKPGDLQPKKRKVYYPTGDGKPMAETVQHRDLMIYAIPALQLHFAHRPDVHISGNDFLYYEEGIPSRRISPDCYVVFGVEKTKPRPFYKVWEENGITPAVVFEFTSKKTRREDEVKKSALYEGALHIQEYFQFDPTGDYLTPRLQGKRLQNGRYEKIALQNDRMYSEQLGLDLVILGQDLRFYDPLKGEWLLTIQEQTRRAEDAQQEATIALQRVAAESRRAEAEARRAEAETRRAENAEAELARLRAELEALRRQRP